MTASDEKIERLYEVAKTGDWSSVVADLTRDLQLGARCARYKIAATGWTFMHQAAHAGEETAVRLLLRLGGSLIAETNDGETPRGVAERRGHVSLAHVMDAATTGEAWDPSSDPTLLPSSSLWNQAQKRKATTELRVAYAGGVVKIAAGRAYYVDSFERILVGWHGTFDPPKGMGGDSML